MIPYGHQSISRQDIKAVISVLQSDYLTQGPQVERFEKALAEYCGARYAVVTCNGTAALQAAYYAVGFQEGDEFITSPITFPATANAGLWQRAKPIFVDIDPQTGNIDAALTEQHIGDKTKALVPIDYAGRPADLNLIKQIAAKHNLPVVEDGCQSLGASYKGQRVGSISDLTVFSFHPVKTITTGEGGAILTNNEKYYRKMKMFITHGVMKKDLFYCSPGDWYFEIQDIGQNYRLSDIQCALGISQLKRINKFLEKRRRLAERYSQALKDCRNIKVPLPDLDNIKSAWHLYVIQLKNGLFANRAKIFRKLREAKIGVQVHHIPVYLHPFFQKLGYRRGICPKAEKFYDSIISLPLYPDITAQEQNYIIKKVKEVLK